MNGFELTVSSLHIEGTNILIKNGSINLKSDELALLNVNREAFDKVNLSVEAEGIAVNGTLRANSLTFVNGEYNVSGLNAIVDSFFVNSDAKVQLSDGSISIISLLSSSVAEDNLVFLNTSINFSDSSFIEGSFSTEGNTILETSGKLYFQSANTIDLLNIKDGELHFLENNNLGYIGMEGEVSIFIEGGKTLSINNVGTELLTALNLTTTEGSTQSATIFSDSLGKICIGATVINKVDASGSTNLVVDPNSTLTDANGWITLPCSEVLDADFEFLFTCVNSLAEFTDGSSGNPTSWRWYLADNPSETLSEDSILFFTFIEVGTYDVVLEVAKEDQLSSITKTVNVVTPDFDLPTIVSQGNRLFSTSFSDNYQWFKNGEPIEGANENSYRVSENEEGEFYVVVSDEGCRLQSESFIIEVTALEESIDRGIRVFPNPVGNGLLKINSNMKIKGARLFDLTGKEIKSTFSISKAVDYELKTDSQSGLYILVIELSDSSLVQKKIIIE